MPLSKIYGVTKLSPAATRTGPGIDAFHGDPVGAAIFDDLVTRPFLTLATSVASVFTMDVHDANAAHNSSVSAYIVDGDWVDDASEDM